MENVDIAEDSYKDFLKLRKQHDFYDMSYQERA